MVGPIEERIRAQLEKEGVICWALIDSEDTDPTKGGEVASRAELCGAGAILVGGSTAIDQIHLDAVTISIKKRVKVPVILFPGNITGISPNADAVLFSSLLNSEDPYFITEAQALGAPLIKRYGLEAIPMGYLVVGDGGAIGFIGRARGIPPNKPNLAAMYALSAQYMGMRVLYLEGGSGVMSHVPRELVSTVRKAFEGLLVVGGGVKNAEDATEIAVAGADVLVVGTLLEQGDFEVELRRIVASLQGVGKKRV